MAAAGVGGEVSAGAACGGAAGLEPLVASGIGLDRLVVVLRDRSSERLSALEDLRQRYALTVSQEILEMVDGDRQRFEEYRARLKPALPNHAEQVQLRKHLSCSETHFLVALRTGCARSARRPPAGNIRILMVMEGPWHSVIIRGATLERSQEKATDLSNDTTRPFGLGGVEVVGVDVAEADLPMLALVTAGQRAQYCPGCGVRSEHSHSYIPRI